MTQVLSFLITFFHMLASASGVGDVMVTVVTAGFL